MPALGVVEHLDVIEHVTACRLPGQLDLPPDPLSLQQLEEAFHHSVVVAVSTPAHAADDPMYLQEGLPLGPRELAALVRVQHEAGIWLALRPYPLAKYAAAFFRMSRSSVTRLSSACRRLFSAANVASP